MGWGYLGASLSALVAFGVGIWCGRCLGIAEPDIKPETRRFGVPEPDRTGMRAKLKTDVRSISGHGAGVKVSWSGVQFGRSADWIGMWDSNTNFDVFSSPIKFRYVMGDPTSCYGHKSKSDCNADSLCEWWGTKCQPGSPKANGTVEFHVWNRRSDVVFMYISGNIQYPSLIAKSEVVKATDWRIPQGGHLALGSQPTSMRVYWQAGGTPSSPGVKFSEKCGELTRFARGWADPARQYKKEDMCDRDTEPAGRQGWHDPGTLLEATLTDLVPGRTYCYSYGDSTTGWSEEQSFIAAPTTGPGRRTVIAAFGDLGQTESDGSFHHSWDFQNRGELPSLNTTRTVAADEAIEMVLHIGDISYAVGYLSEWDNFFRQIHPIASRKPWMTSIGNHEMVWSRSFYPGTDSGGECGVPFNAYFPFASQAEHARVPLSQRRSWYAFKYGPVTFVQMSTEHNFTKGSDQHQWIDRVLGAVNRSETPWVVFSGHRPMYPQPDYDHSGRDLQTHVEPLLLAHGVDLALWAHFHAWTKYCKLRAGKCDDTGVQHLIIGMAGYDHSRCEQHVNEISTCNDSEWGWLRMSFQSDSELLLEFVSSATGKTVESFTMKGNAARLGTVATIAV